MTSTEPKDKKQRIRVRVTHDTGLKETKWWSETYIKQVVTKMKKGTSQYRSIEYRK